MRRLILVSLLAACGPAVSGPDDGGAGGLADASTLADSGPLPDLGVYIPKNCSAVDVLFVIDNSLSMGPYQEKLAQAFPTFADAIYQRLPPRTSVHVGITTTSFYSGSCSEFTVNCGTTASVNEILNHYVRPQDGDTGTNGEQGRLYQYLGLSYYDADTSGDPNGLKYWFSGAAVAAGETGCSFEVSSAAAGYAFHSANATANAGFLRDKDAVLVIIVLSDEPDKSPEGTAYYHDLVTAAKPTCGGDACVITAGIVDPCIVDTNQSLWQFLTSFGETPSWTDIDGPVSAYTGVVGDALAQVVQQTCEEIVQ